MTQEEKDIVLKECNEKILGIESKKQDNEHTWNEYYNKNYKTRFMIEDKVDSFISSKVAGGTILVSSAAIFSASHSFVLAIGVPVGGYAIATLSSVALNLFNNDKKIDYWMELEEHQHRQYKLDSECYPYRVVSKYLTDGDKYLLQLYRENLDVDVTSVDKSDLDYLDIDTTNLTPLMIKAIEEVKTRTLYLRNELRESILSDISFMHTQIVDSANMSISELESYQKMLKGHVPEGTLTS